MRILLWFESFAKAIILALSVFFVTPSPARAAMVFCNHTQNPIEIAFGYREEKDWMSEGWWRIEPSQCARVYNKALSDRYYFYYANSIQMSTAVRTPIIWNGKYKFCTSSRAFRIRGSNCAKMNYEEKGFQSLDVGANTHNYALDFVDQDKR